MVAPFALRDLGTLQELAAQRVKEVSGELFMAQVKYRVALRLAAEHRPELRELTEKHWHRRKSPR